jgi:hypothetical protein
MQLWTSGRRRQGIRVIGIEGGSILGSHATGNVSYCNAGTRLQPLVVHQVIEGKVEQHDASELFRGPCPMNEQLKGR